jgi:hypothetical protein
MIAQTATCPLYFNFFHWRVFPSCPWLKEKYGTAKSFDLTKLNYHSCWYTDQVAVTKNITDITYGIFDVRKKAKKNIQNKWFIHLWYKISIGIKRTNIKLSFLLNIVVSASSYHSKLYDANLCYALLLTRFFSFPVFHFSFLRSSSSFTFLSAGSFILLL